MKNSIIKYNPKLKLLARKLRNNSTKSEIYLWNRIKGKQLGVRFIRQKPIDNYIVDFYCKELMLAIEIDGYSHSLEEVYYSDVKRDIKLEELGIEVLRINESIIFNDMENALRLIVGKIDELSRR
ncbi:MAG: DUF559 domain-containing protein [Flavobacteriales bacterium]|nr:DUF559 domain-containing protein [Flavobacteriales bacterium]